MEKTRKSRAKSGNKGCDNLPICNTATTLGWYKSLTEQDVGLTEDKILYFVEGGISAVF